MMNFCLSFVPELVSSLEYDSGSIKPAPALLYPGPRTRLKLWCVKDVAGMACAGMTVLLLAYAEFAVVVMTIWPWYEFRVTSGSVGLTASYTAVLFMALWAHFTAMTSDPGSVPLRPPGYQVQETCLGGKPFEKFGEKVTICKKCSYYKPTIAHHCSTCGRCVRKLDHHCPWVNNCVGERNQKFFLLFLLYILLSTIYSAAVVGVRFQQCATRGMAYCHMDQNPVAQMACGIILLLEALLFGIFVTVMGCDQMNGLRDNLTGIDRLKGHQGGNAQSTFSERFSQVFGGGEFRWSWLLPVAPPIRLPEWYP